MFQQFQLEFQLGVRVDFEVSIRGVPLYNMQRVGLVSTGYSCHYLSPTVTPCHHVSPHVITRHHLSPSVTTCRHMSSPDIIRFGIHRILLSFPVTTCHQLSPNAFTCHHLSSMSPPVTICHHLSPLAITCQHQQANSPSGCVLVATVQASLVVTPIRLVASTFHS